MMTDISNNWEPLIKKFCGWQMNVVSQSMIFLGDMNLWGEIHPTVNYM